MKNGTVLYKYQNGVATIILNRPEVKNAINVSMHEDLQLAFSKAANDHDVKVIVLKGKDGAFSSGADLKSIPVDNFSSFDHGEYLRDTYNKLIMLIDSIDKPTIAYINGIGVGAGLSIALACDFRYASADARLGISFLKIALVPDAGASYYLPRLVGLQKAIELSLGDTITAEEAVQCGLINQIGPPTELIENLKSLPSTAYGLMKKNMRASYELTLPAMLEREVEAQRKAGKDPEHLMAIQSFMKKKL